MKRFLIGRSVRLVCLGNTDRSSGTNNLGAQGPHGQQDQNDERTGMVKSVTETHWLSRRTEKT